MSKVLCIVITTAILTSCSMESVNEQVEDLKLMQLIEEQELQNRKLEDEILNLQDENMQLKIENDNKNAEIKELRENEDKLRLNQINLEYLYENSENENKTELRRLNSIIDEMKKSSNETIPIRGQEYYHEYIDRLDNHEHTLGYIYSYEFKGYRGPCLTATDITTNDSKILFSDYEFRDYEVSQDNRFLTILTGDGRQYFRIKVFQLPSEIIAKETFQYKEILDLDLMNGELYSDDHDFTTILGYTDDGNHIWFSAGGAAFTTYYALLDIKTGEVVIVKGDNYKEQYNKFQKILVEYPLAEYNN